MSSEDSLRHRENPQMRRRARSIAKRSISPRHGQSQYRLGHKGIRQPGTFVRRSSFSAPWRRHKLFDAYPIQRMDDFLKLRRQRSDALPQLGQKLRLNHIPALHDQVASGSIHLAGVMIMLSKTYHARNGRLHPPVSPPVAKYSHPNPEFFKWLNLQQF